MTKNFDKILLSVLWLLTIVLATTFWMNIRYGFDIFSAAHWEYISRLQANRAHLKQDFYISLILALFLALIGLYMILRPRFRKIPMPDSAQQPEQPQNSIPTTPQAPDNNAMGPSSTMRPPSPPALKSGMARKQNSQQFTPPTARISTQPQIAAPETKANPLSKDISVIFEAAGYIMKPCKKLGNLHNPVVALGYDQTLWIGTSDAAAPDMIEAIQTLVTVFDDTLGDSADDITLRGCIVAPTETADNELVSNFATIDELKQFIGERPNNKPADFDNELFEAISTYISTVTSYIGKE